MTAGYLWIVWTLATGQTHSCEAVAVCGEDDCRVTVLTCTAPPSLATCLSASAYVGPDSEESDDVLGCTMDGRTAILDPWFGGEL